MQDLGDLDQEAWQAFCKLVGEGAGVSDCPNDQDSGSLRPSSHDYAYMVDLVRHHVQNHLPFLLQRCDIAGKSIMEFGGGTAGLSVAMVRGGASFVTAVEPVQKNFEAAILRVKAHRLEDRIRFHHVPDTRTLSFDANVFDACVCSSVLQYIPAREHRQRVLGEMYRVVKPGGVVCICGSGNGLWPWGPHSSTWWSNLLPARAARLGHTRGVTYWEILEIFRQLGAERVRPRDPQDNEITRWQTRARAGGKTPRRLLRWAAWPAYRLAEATICAPFDLPIEMFLPFISVAFKKPAAQSR